MDQYPIKIDKCYICGSHLDNYNCWVLPPSLNSIAFSPTFCYNCSKAYRDYCYYYYYGYSAEPLSLALFIRDMDFYEKSES